MDHHIILFIANLCLDISMFVLISFTYLGKAYFCLIQWFSKVFATFFPFRTWVPSFPPSKKEYLNDQTEEFFCKSLKACHCLYQEA